MRGKKIVLICGLGFICTNALAERLEVVKESISTTDILTGQQSDSQNTKSKTDADLKLSNTDQIQDPTQMTGSFTKALSQIQNKSGNINGKLKNQYPEIKLISKKVSADNSNYVILSIEGKYYSSKAGETFSCLWQNEWLEVEINSIDKVSVELTINPIKKHLILH